MGTQEEGAPSPKILREAVENWKGVVVQKLREMKCVAHRFLQDINIQSRIKGS